MTLLAFDMHRAIKPPCKAGAMEPLAEVFVVTIGDAIGGNVGTKGDVSEPKGTLRADITEIKTDLEAKYDEVGSNSRPRSATWRRGGSGSCGSWRSGSPAR